MANRRATLKGIALVLLLGGCVKVPEWEIAASIEACRPKSGLAEIVSGAVTHAHCRNGEYVRIP